MFEAFAAAIVLGITAGLCPICLVFALPFLPIITSRFNNPLTAIRVSLLFSAGIAVVFAPLGYIAAYIVGGITGGSSVWVFLIVALIAIFMGLLALRLIKVSYSKFCKQYGINTFGLGSFGYGLWFGFITVARAAPLLISMLSIAAVNEPVVGAVALSIYGLLMGMPIVALTAIIGLARVKDMISKHSRKLDNVSGIFLLGIGAYYLLQFILSQG